MLVEDLDTFLAVFGVPVTWGTTSGVGILDMPDDIIGQGMAISTEYALQCKTSDFGSVQYQDAITVDGVSYLVRDVKRIGDGAFCRVSLTKV